jgi:triosephosphate isomerase
MSQSFSRPTIIAGNWKMYKTIEEAKSFVESLAPLIKKSQAAVYLAVPFTAIYPTVQYVRELKTSITVGAQNMNDASQGAFTGEVAGKMLKEAGTQFVILGHSERRALFHEDDALVNRKVKRALAEGLQPLLCIGETLEQREHGRIEEVLRRELELGLQGLLADDLSKVVIAYEPVWAIGTGKVATPEDVQEAHQFCRTVIREIWGHEVAEQVVIQYGGSVKPDNAAALIALADVDGFLVGGASLLSSDFSQIINIVNKYLKKRI